MVNPPHLVAGAADAVESGTKSPKNYVETNELGFLCIIALFGHAHCLINTIHSRISGEMKYVALCGLLCP